MNYTAFTYEMNFLNKQYVYKETYNSSLRRPVGYNTTTNASDLPKEISKYNTKTKGSNIENMSMNIIASQRYFSLKVDHHTI